MSTIAPLPPTAPGGASTSTQPQPSISPVQSATLRLSTLQYLIGSSPNPSSNNSAILQRLTSAISALETIKCKSGKPLTRLVDDWDSYADLLHPLDPSVRSGREEVWDAKEQATYLLTQYDELKELLRDLTKMETLLEQGKVLDGESSRMLSRAITIEQRQKLQALQKEVRSQDQRTKTNQQRVLNLVSDWSHYTSTVSQTFTLLDQDLLHLERAVLALERECNRDAE
ncbi:hypothetical protein NDA18_004915 [Ustilago nuda]|nr:hypothetical protein NDA18_004915 [Ustilago nuda]